MELFAVAIRPFDIAALCLVGRKEVATDWPDSAPEEQLALPETAREKALKVQMVCLLVANGESVDVTARKVGMSAKEVQTMIGRPDSMDMIVRFQADGGKPVSQRIKSLAQIAVDVQTRLLLDPATAPTVRAKVAQEVIDRSEGKAIQVTENRNLSFDMKDAAAIDRQMVAQVQKLERIEQMQKKLAISVAASPDPISHS